MNVKATLAGTVCAMCITVSASAATLVNGSLDGSIVNGGVPTGWTTLLGSPDTNDINNNVGGAVSYPVAPNASPDGGTWVGFANDVGVFEEQFGQTISDFVVGQEYNLSWYGGNFGAIDYLGDNSIFASLDGTVVGSGASLTLGSDWFEQSITFTATATTHLLGFGLSDNVRSYLSIDGISLSVATVPVPAAGLLLFSGLFGFGALRRKKS